MCCSRPRSRPTSLLGRALAGTSTALPTLYRQAERIIAVSDGVAENMRLLCAGTADRIVTVPNGVALDRIGTRADASADHPWLQATNRAPVLLAVGRLVEKKDYPALLRALHLVRRTCPARLIILGDGPERGRLEALTRELGISESVSMPGFCTNPFAYFARASLTVLSSISEGMPSALIEALACGCPVVSTDCPSGPSEILDGGRYGALVPVGNPEVLAEAVLETLRRPRDGERLRARAAEFSVEACVERYAQILMAAHGQSAGIENR
jgi:glycosyltransferase involved in cell wall biosynthesis